MYRPVVQTLLFTLYGALLQRSQLYRTLSKVYRAFLKLYRALSECLQGCCIGLSYSVCTGLFCNSVNYAGLFWEYGVATISRLLKIIGLLCRISSLL